MTPPLLGFVLVLSGSAAAWALTRRGHRAMGAVVLVLTALGLVAAAVTAGRDAAWWILGGVVGAAVGQVFLWRRKPRPSTS